MSFSKNDQISGKGIRENQNKNCFGSICSHKHTQREAAEDRLGCAAAPEGHIKGRTLTKGVSSLVYMHTTT